MSKTTRDLAMAAEPRVESTASLLRELVAHLRQQRAQLREEWARLITEAKLLTAMTKEEIFAEATSVYDNYVEALETGTYEALQAYARNLSERIIQRGVETHEDVGIVLLLRDVLARLDASRNDAFREVARVGLQGRVRPRLQRLELGGVQRGLETTEVAGIGHLLRDVLARLDASRNGAFREVARVGLQGLVRPRLEGLDVVVVHRGRLGEDLFLRHRRQQLGLGDEPGPHFAQLGALLPQVRHELAQQRGRRLDARLGGHRQIPGRLTHRAPPACSPDLLCLEFIRRAL